MWLSLRKVSLPQKERALLNVAESVRLNKRGPAFWLCGPRRQRRVYTLGATRTNGCRPGCRKAKTMTISGATRLKRLPPGCHKATRVAHVCRKARIFRPRGTQGQAQAAADIVGNTVAFRE